MTLVSPLYYGSLGITAKRLYSSVVFRKAVLSLLLTALQRNARPAGDDGNAETALAGGPVDWRRLAHQRRYVLSGLLVTSIKRPLPWIIGRLISWVLSDGFIVNWCVNIGALRKRSKMTPWQCGILSSIRYRNMREKIRTVTCEVSSRILSLLFQSTSFDFWNGLYSSVALFSRWNVFLYFSPLFA